MPYFPTEQWLEEYRRLLNESEAFSDLGAGWGEGFDGDVLYVITDIPLEETTLGELPDGVLADLPAHVQERVAEVAVAEAPETFAPIRSGLPEAVTDKLDQLEAHVHGDTVYAYVGLEDGECTEVEVLETPDAREVGFVLRGSFDTWKAIVDGRPSASAVISGDLDFEGNRLRRMRYSPMFQMLGQTAADVETTHLFEADDDTRRPVLDTALKSRMYVQQRTHRGFKRALQRL